MWEMRRVQRRAGVDRAIQSSSVASVKPCAHRWPIARAVARELRALGSTCWIEKIHKIHMNSRCTSLHQGSILKGTNK